MGIVHREPKKKSPDKAPKEKEKKRVDFTRHGVLVCGFDEVHSGWAIECICGFFTTTLPLMEMVGEEFDNHLRLTGILRDGTDV